MGAIIWQKTTTMNTTGGGAIMGSFPYPRNGILKMDYEFILIFKKPGNAPKPTKEQKDNSIITKEEWNQYFSSHWNFNGVRQHEHIAMFPEELPKRLIKMFSYVGETVFDPFLGSGTTSLVAEKLDRNSIGYEINSSFLPLIKEKIDGDQLSFASPQIKYFEDTIRPEDLSFDSLPYVFHDPHNMDKKIDVKKLQFGSKIDNTRMTREEYFSVTEVISPEKILLSNGVVIKLIGIKAIEQLKGQAIDFLKEKTKKHKVFMKFDEEKFDKENNLLCYLYLENKTFINAHLIRSGLVTVDNQQQYKYKNKFKEIENG
jgi:site-specific DNA-methyltransferase (adenine-specific)